MELSNRKDKKGQHIFEVLYHHCMSNGRGELWYKTPFSQTDRQKDRKTHRKTDSQPW